MSGFKRNSSKFSKDNATAVMPVVSPVTPVASENRSASGARKPFDFQSIGSLTVPKSVNDELRDMILEELRNSDIKLNLKVYLPKGVNSVTLNRDDLVLLTFKVSDKDPKFVVGKALIPNN